MKQFVYREPELGALEREFAKEGHRLSLCTAGGGCAVKVSMAICDGKQAKTNCK